MLGCKGSYYPGIMKNIVLQVHVNTLRNIVLQVHVNTLRNIVLQAHKLKNVTLHLHVRMHVHVHVGTLFYVETVTHVSQVFKPSLDAYLCYSCRTNRR